MAETEPADLSLPMKPLVLLTTVGLLVAEGCGSGWSEADQQRHDWVAERYESVLDEVLPLECESALSCRMTRDFWVEQPELSVTLEDPPGRGSVLRVRTPVGPSVWDQLGRLHRSKRDASETELASAVRIAVENVELDACPELRAVVGDRGEHAP